MGEPREDVKEILAVLNRRVHAIDTEREALGAERMVLLRTRAYYESLSDNANAPARHATGETKKATPPSAPSIFSTMGLTEAVRSYIQRFPGYTAPQVADALETVVKTKSQDRRKTISWIITDLVRRKEIERREEGKLYPTKVAQLIGQGELIEQH